MGSDKADTHIILHGEGSIHHTPQCRLHFGNESIDETHDMPSAVVLQLAAHYLSASWSDFRTEFHGWMQSAGVSPEAWGKRDAFAAAARRALGTA